VAEYSKPDKPLDVATSLSTDGDYIDLSWEIPFDGNYPILLFRVKYYDSTGLLLEELDAGEDCY
jgi:hypothetical protein